MCYAWVPYAIAAVGAAYSGYNSYQQGNFQEDVSEYNARQLENEATRTRNKGVEEEVEHRKLVKQLIGEQRATQAAAGVDVNSGSPLQLQVDTEMQGEIDALRIRENYDYRIASLGEQRRLTLAEGDAARQQGRNQLMGSVLTAAGYMAGSGAIDGIDSGAGELVASSWYNNNSSAVQQSRSSPSPGMIG